MKNISICIIDYGLGNLTSVKNSLALLNIDALVSHNISDIQKATHLILPGVGSFEHGMKGLRERNLISILQQEVRVKKKKILGICLGMQLFATEGSEYGNHEGLDFIPGRVTKIDISYSGYRLPHIGWNNVRTVGAHSITKNFDKDPIFYFVHSYHFVPDNKNAVAGVCDYGHEIVSVVENENIFGVQFHPEKSHEDGLQIFKNFLNV